MSWSPSRSKSGTATPPPIVSASSFFPESPSPVLTGVPAPCLSGRLTPSGIKAWPEPSGLTALDPDLRMLSLDQQLAAGEDRLLVPLGGRVDDPVAGGVVGGRVLLPVGAGGVRPGHLV